MHSWIIQVSFYYATHYYYRFHHNNICQIILFQTQLQMGKHIKELIAQLIEPTPQDQIDAYDTYLRTHLKFMLTGVSKARVQDISEVSKRKNQCILNCYKKQMSKVENWDDDAMDTVEGIRQCKEKCGKEKQAVKKFLDDINYYSKLKYTNCMKDCKGNQLSQAYNVCKWGCLSRLDRRYKRYWMEQRLKIQQQYKLE